MRVVHSLWVVLAVAATLGMVYALTRTLGTMLFELPPRQASITPASGSKVEAGRHGEEISRMERAPASPKPASPKLGPTEPAATEVVILAPRGGIASSQPSASPWSDHLPLAQRLQRELARVGCYDGEMNGVWTPATRRALKAFMDRVNAALPTETPDRIQLALVEAARERVCGAACPAG
ncbi:MAG: peptidoglycan-binding protein, partial [Hyphomicrobiaceae bacterium]|nr:peptidoglycan-binding protein [Hyphomicrobiaceae bacterium]